MSRKEKLCYRLYIFYQMWYNYCEYLQHIVTEEEKDTWLIKATMQTT